MDDILEHNNAVLQGHNPDSQCFECCKKIEDLHSQLSSLMSKIAVAVEAFDGEKLNKLMENPMIKLLLR